MTEALKSVKFLSKQKKVLSYLLFQRSWRFFLLFIMAGSNSLKDYLNDRMSDSITSRPYREMQDHSARLDQLSL